MKAARSFGEERRGPARGARPRPSSLLRLLGRWRASRTRKLAHRALQHSREELGIDWPVELVWERGLPDLGQVHSAKPDQIQMREDQGGEEGVRTTFHEVYHLAQFHKWRTLSPRWDGNTPGEMLRAEALAELYSQVTYRELARARRRRWWEALLPRFLKEGRGLFHKEESRGTGGEVGRKTRLPGYVPFGRWSTLSVEEQREILSLVEWKRGGRDRPR